jgi:diguanylate cyclase (GGDEF)-like protein/PAS domain S-box-containing protein
MSKSWSFETFVRRWSVTRGVGIGVAAVLTAAAFFISERLLREYGALTGAGLADGSISGFPIDLHVLAHAVQIGFVALLVALVVDAELLTGPALRRVGTERRELSAAAREAESARLAAGELETRLAQSESRFQSIFESPALGMALCAGDGRLLRVNRALCDLLGYSARELEGMNLLSITHPDDFANAAAVFRAIDAGASGPFRLEQRYATFEARTAVTQVNIAVVRDADGGVMFCAAQIENITARRRAEESVARYAADLRALALTDDLTGLHNRRGFRTLSERICAAQPRSRQPLMLVAVDVDYLKAINDTWGHAEGDRAIMVVAAALKVSFRTSDVVARVGGDEFLCLLPNAGDDDVTQIRHRIATRIAREVEEAGDFQIPVTVTVGVAIAPPRTPVDLDGLMREADRAMYDAKRGRVKRDLVGVRLS